jgi:hypothetical protein
VPVYNRPAGTGAGGGHYIPYVPVTQHSGGTYNAYQCGRFGLSCSNFNPKKAVPKPSSFNPFHWVAHAATNLWDNIPSGPPLAG